MQNRLISDKITRIKDYFTELCQLQGIDFLIFERLPLNITLSASDKSLKEQVANFVSEVSKSLQLIESLSDPDEFKAEVLTEYKQTLDVTRAIQNAQYRKQQREAELQRIEEQKKRAEQARLEAEAKAQVQATLQAPEQVQPVQATQAQPAPELVQTTFTVRGTREQLQALKQYIISNNIQIL